MLDDFRTAAAERATTQATGFGINFLRGGIVAGGAGDGGVGGDDAGDIARPNELQNFIQRLREFTTKRGINFFMAPSNMDLQDLLLKQLRKSEVWG